MCYVVVHIILMSSVVLALSPGLFPALTCYINYTLKKVGSGLEMRLVRCYSHTMYILILCCSTCVLVHVHACNVYYYNVMYLWTFQVLSTLLLS